jgi:hypothetical protein
MPDVLNHKAFGVVLRILFEKVLTERIRADNREAERFVKVFVVCDDQFAGSINRDNGVDRIFKIIGEMVRRQ